MTLEQTLKNRFMELIRPLTPFIIEEARWRLFDVAAYFPEDATDKRFKVGVVPTKEVCGNLTRREGKGVCRVKSDEFDERYAWKAGYELFPEDKEKARDTFYQEKETGEIHTKEEYFKLMDDSMDTMLCERKGCKYLARMIAWRVERYRDFNQGLYLFEFKSDHDNIKRYMDQLPNYLLFADYHYLVIGAKQKIPEWLPTFVGVYRYDEDKRVFIRESQGSYITRATNDINFAQYMLKKEFPGLKRANSDVAFEILKDWFINSIFYFQEGRMIRPMKALEEIWEFKARTKKSEPAVTLEDFQATVP